MLSTCRITSGEQSGLELALENGQQQQPVATIARHCSTPPAPGRAADKKTTEAVIRRCSICSVADNL